MTSTVLEICGLTVRCRGRLLLEVESMRAMAGGITALMGPNGAGKTTLLRICLGMAKAERGEVKVLGEDVRRLKGTALARLRRRIGYVPQLLPTQSEMPLTIREVVAIGRTARAGLFHPLTRADWQVVDRWLGALGLAPLADRAFGQASGGEQRKAIIARAMVQEPELLLLDEPTANLDLGWRERIVEALESLYAQSRISVILVCHELEVLPIACRQIILLDQGRLVTTGSPEEVFTPDRVTSLYGARLEAMHRNGRHAVVPGESR